MNLNIFVVGFLNSHEKIIKKCKRNLEHIELDKCEDFTDKEVLHFFYKEGNYVMVTK